MNLESVFVFDCSYQEEDVEILKIVAVFLAANRQRPADGSLWTENRLGQKGES